VKWDLRLYVAGSSPKSSVAFRNLEQLCEEHLAGHYRIEIVDLTKNPELWQADQILNLANAGAKTAFANPQNHRQSVRYKARSRHSRLVQEGVTETWVSVSGR